MRTDRFLAPVAGLAVLIALYMAFVWAPTEQVMGDVQRIFYFHVASAWSAFTCFFVVAGASAVYLWRGNEAADRLALASAEVGVLFCTLVLITGPIWARPIWGVWWTWDPRLTMTIILWGVYVGYLMLRSFGGPDEAVARYAAVLGIVGVLDIPVIRVSVRLLQGMHPSVLQQREGGGSGLDPDMRLTMFVAAGAVLLFTWWLIALRMRLERTAIDVATLRRTLEAREGSAA